MTRVPRAVYLAALSLLIVFTIDILTPPAFVVDVLYLCCMVLVFKQSSKVIISFSCLACLLIIVNLIFVDFKQGLTLSLGFNRVISLLAVLIATYLAIRYRKLNEASLLKTRSYAKALEDMLFITSHQVRKPVANIIGLVEDIGSGLAPDELQQRYEYLKASANELDEVVRELNSFMENTEV